MSTVVEEKTEQVTEKGPVPNDANGLGTAAEQNGRRPRTPSLHGLALTEYSVNPSPPRRGSEQKKTEQIRKLVPDDLLLPNGYPDVSGMDVGRR